MYFWSCVREYVCLCVSVCEWICACWLVFLYGNACVCACVDTIVVWCLRAPDAVESVCGLGASFLCCLCNVSLEEQAWSTCALVHGTVQLATRA